MRRQARDFKCKLLLAILFQELKEMDIQNVLEENVKLMMTVTCLKLVKITRALIRVTFSRVVKHTCVKFLIIAPFVAKNIWLHFLSFNGTTQYRFNQPLFTP